MPFWVETFLGPALLIALMAGYDLATRKRLHPVFVWGSSGIVGIQALTSLLYVSPWWKGVATGLIARFG